MDNRFTIIITDNSNKDLLKMFMTAFEAMTEEQRKTAPSVATK